MRNAATITLTDEHIQLLQRGHSTPTRLVLRAKIVLLFAAGIRNDELAQTLGCTRRA